METKLDPIVNKMAKCVIGLLVFLGCLMMVVAWIHVFFRYVLGNSLTWSEEFLKICLVWFGMLSVSMISQQRQHIGIVIFKEKMPKFMEYACDTISEVLMLLASVTVAAIGILLIKKTMGQYTPALRWPVGIGYSAIPVAFSLMTFYEFRNLIFDIKKLNAKNME